MAIGSCLLNWRAECVALFECQKVHHRDALPREYFVIGSGALAWALIAFCGHGDCRCGRGVNGSEWEGASE
jgi:hypothetical protein